jgi:hypothetical protein
LCVVLLKLALREDSTDAGGQMGRLLKYARIQREKVGLASPGERGMTNKSTLAFCTYSSGMDTCTEITEGQMAKTHMPQLKSSARKRQHGSSKFVVLT